MMFGTICRVITMRITCVEGVLVPNSRGVTLVHVAVIRVIVIHVICNHNEDANK